MASDSSTRPPSGLTHVRADGTAQYEAPDPTGERAVSKQTAWLVSDVTSTVDR